MEATYGELNNQGSTQPDDSSDIIYFKNTYQTNPSELWWESNVDLDMYFSHIAIQEACHHGDLTHKNHFFYHNCTPRDSLPIIFKYKST